jgi:hypothetical protein
MFMPACKVSFLLPLCFAVGIVSGCPDRISKPTDAATDALVQETHANPDSVDSTGQTDDLLADAGPTSDSGGPDEWFPFNPLPASDPAIDSPFLQELNHTVNEQPEGLGQLVALATPEPPFDGEGRPVLVAPQGIYRWLPSGAVELLPLPEASPDIVGAQAIADRILLAAPQQLWSVGVDGVYAKGAGLDGLFLRFAPGHAGPLVVTTMGIFQVTGKTLTPLLAMEGVGTATTDAHHLFVATAQELSITRLDALDQPPLATVPLSIGNPVAMVTGRTLPVALDLVVVGTKGLAGYTLSEGSLTPLAVPLFAPDRLPLQEARVAVPDPNGGFAVGAMGGAYRLVSGQYGVEYRTYVPDRWLPSPDVTDVAMPTAAPGSIYIATQGGLGWVTTTTWSVADKTMTMVESIVDHHDRDGAVADCKMAVPGDPSSCIPWDSDNDGGWTCYWVLGECFRYLVTGDPTAKAHFDRSLERMLSLRTLTGTEHFLARSVIRIEGCQLDDCDNPDDGEWFKSPDGKWWVKADTSNDEVTSHMFMMGHAYDLCADEAQKDAIVAHVDGIVGGLVDHDYKLLDPQDNKPTSYGQFGPDYCNDWVEGMWADGGRRSAQLMGALNLALYLTGKEKYRVAKETLMSQFHYDENISHIGDIDVYPLCAGNGDCDELAMQAFLPLIRYEVDPARREQWQAAWAQLYSTLITQEDGVWDLANALFGAPEPDLSRVIRWLQGYPTDFIRWQMHNGARTDAVPPPGYYLNKDPNADYRRRSDGHIFPPDERPNERHNTPQFKFSGGHGPGVEIDSADVLFAYWMARYYGAVALEP